MTDTPKCLLPEWEEVELMLMDGYEDCIAGVVERFGQSPIVCYDKNKVLAKTESEGMTYDEAIEFWDFNQIGAWMGALTPCFISLVDKT